MKNSKIEWTHHTFNPWWGCTKVSDACAHCYAETFAKRTGHDVWGPEKPRRFFGDKHWNEPLGWNDRPLVCPKGSTPMPGAPGGHGPYCASSCANDKECPECGALLEHARVFCASMADIFEDYTGPDIIRLQNERARLFNLITGTPNLDWLLLTKRPENILTMVPESWLSKFPENVWAMTTVENQEQANTRIPHLLKVPARVRGLSMEPLLEEVHIFNEVSGDLEYWSGKEDHSDRIDWIICGGESGPGARPMHPKWARSVRDQCQAAHDGVPFFFKQWGDWLPYKMGHAYIDGFHEARTLQPSPEIRDQGWPVYRVGKAKAGRLLDGKEWNELPG